MGRRNFKLKSLLVLSLTFILYTTGILAQVITVDEMPRALYYYKMKRVEKLKDMKNMKDVFHTDKFLMGRNIFSGNISNHMGRVVVDDGKKLNEEFRYSLGFFTRFLIYDEFSINTTFFKHFNDKPITQLIPDYTYSFGRFHWKPKTFNFGYENFGNNKYSDNAGMMWEKFKQGYYFVSYAHLLPENWMKYLVVDNSSNIRLTWFTRYAMFFQDNNFNISGGVFNGKPVAGLAIRYTIAMNFYIESAYYNYFIESRNKQPWDADYSYGFGYYDWRAFRVSITYGNWAINKFPWNSYQNPYSYYGFLDGNFRINFNYSW